MTKKKVNTLNIFISGESSVGKSYLINTIYQTLTRTFNLYSGTQQKVRVLKMAATDVAAVNRNGATINTALSIPTTKGSDIPKIDD